MKRLVLLLLPVFATGIATAQDENARSIEIYGFAMLDFGYNANQINPNWFDALRINRLPKYKNEFAPDGQVFFGVRQTRFGVRGYTPTPLGELKVVYEFDMFGTGVDEGQTTMRLRHAYGQVGKFLAGQAHSPFMDENLWPNTIEYWGPPGMVFFRNVQLRFMPLQGANELWIALERPGASSDQGVYADRIELDSVRARNSMPDISAHYKKSGKWGHVQLAGMYRMLKWEDIHTTGGYDLSGEATGWGVHLSTVLNVTPKTAFRGSIVTGEGIQNYMQDAPTDVGLVVTGNPAKPADGAPLPITGYMAWIDHNWNDKWWTSIGYSGVAIDNVDAAAGTTSYKKGDYAMLTIGTTPFKNFMTAIEFQWGQREGEDGFKSEAFKVHIGVKYSFSQIFNFNKKGAGQD